MKKTNKRKMELARRRFRFYGILSIVALSLSIVTYQGMDKERPTAVASISQETGSVVEFHTSSGEKRVLSTIIDLGVEDKEENQLPMFIIIDDELLELKSVSDIPEGREFKKAVYTDAIVYSEIE